MKKRVLVIGGSYFVGRVFMVLASRTGEYEFHVVNRGRFKLKLDGVTEYVCDRHDTAKLANILPGHDWDAVVDFCAYEPDDIAPLVEAIPGSVKQYIYISTCSVYDPLSDPPKTEESPLLHATSDDIGIAYAFKKLQLEREAKTACDNKGAALTILRPAFIYGPLNYAPRESYYFKLIMEGARIPQPTDAKSFFSFVYVKDVAKILMRCIGDEATYGEVYNLAAPDRLSYDNYLRVLMEIHGSTLPLEPLTVSQILAQRIPLPFPLKENELYSGLKLIKSLDFLYTPFEDGMKETYDSYMDAHKPR